MTTVVGLGALLVAAAPASAQPTFQRVFTRGVGPYANAALVRMADGSLHVMYQTTTGTSPAPTGLATRVISPAGKLSPVVPALSDWTPATPGLTAQPDGTLLAAFGAISPSNVSSMWTIASSDGGQSWSAPAATPTSVTQAYGAGLNVQELGATPVFTLAVSGGVTTQQGTAAGAPSSLLVDSSDDFAMDVNSAVDSSGEVIVSWDSLAGSGGDFMREAAPQLGPVQEAPGGPRDELQLAARSAGGGVFAPYTSDKTHVRLLRYGAGSVAVGRLAGVSASSLGDATGPAGRIWVMWGDGSGIAITRSNMAVTRFEPIQHLKLAAVTLYRVSGDGLLGPLDLFVDEIPSADIHAPGELYTRVLPLLSVAESVSVHHGKKGVVTGYGVKVTVTDAGDAIGGASVKLGAKTVITSKSGIAQLGFGPGAGSMPVTVTAPGYQVHHGHVRL